MSNRMPSVSDEVGLYVPMYVRLREELRKVIETKASGAALPTIVSIKKQFKVSQPTVERAIQDLRAEGLVTSRRGSGIYVTEQAKVIHAGVVFDADILDVEFGDFYRVLVRSLQLFSGDASIMLRHYITELLEDKEHDRYSAVVHDVSNHRLDALIVLAAYWRRPLNTTLPVIGFGYLPQTTHRVHLDQAATVRQGLEALVGQGRRRIAFLETTIAPRRESERRALRKTASALGVTIRPEWIQPVGGYVASEAIQSGAQAIKAIWAAPGEKPDGLVCVDEYATRGVLNAAPELGIVPGKELKIASHASKGATVLAEAPVTRIEFDPADVGRSMISLIGKITEGKPTETDIFVPPSATRKAKF